MREIEPSCTQLGQKTAHAAGNQGRLPTISRLGGEEIQKLGPASPAQEGVSDLVQETLLDALRDFRRFEGNSERELKA
jgi:hypothetical protein